LSPLVSQRLALLPTKESAGDYERLATMIEAGEVTPGLDSTFALEDAVDAVRRLERGEVRGKVAIVTGTAPEEG